MSSNYTSKDEGEGYVYLVEAVGFHGILSPWRRRVKIGLTNCPERRLKELNSEQAPCPIEGIRAIAVSNNKRVESKLHERFKDHRVHGEWFDFWAWEMEEVHKEMSRHFKKRQRTSVKWVVVGVAVVGLSVAIATGSITVLIRQAMQPKPLIDKELDRVLR